MNKFFGEVKQTCSSFKSGILTLKKRSGVYLGSQVYTGLLLYGSWGYYHEIWHDEAQKDVF